MMTGGSGVLDNDGTTVVPLYPDGSVVDDQTSQGESENVNEENQDATSQEESEAAAAQQELNNMEELQATLNSLFKEEGVDTSVSTNIDNRGLVISLDNTLFFDSGSADIKTENENTLLKIANAINTQDNYIRIEGHTDNIPISTSVYPSNWELSAARATSVVRLFVDKCNINPEKMVAVGYGEFRPIADNSTEEGRNQNRRIDIIVLSEKYDSLEDQLSE